jgi:hypothetical protein
VQFKHGLGAALGLPGCRTARGQTDGNHGRHKRGQDIDTEPGAIGYGYFG